MKKIRDRKEIKKLKKKEINMNMYLGKILRRQLDNANPKVQNTPVHTHASTIMVKTQTESKEKN